MIIMIVDDSPTALLHCQLHLESAARQMDIPITIVTANTGSKALELAQEKLVDLTFLDVELPDMDGFTVCKKLKEQALSIKVGYVTGTTDTRMIEEATRSKGDFVIKKPVSANSFTELLLEHQMAES